MKDLTVEESRQAHAAHTGQFSYSVDMIYVRPKKCRREDELSPPTYLPHRMMAPGVSFSSLGI